MTNYLLYDYMSPEQGLDQKVCPKHIIYPKQLERQIYTKHTRSLGERIKTTYYGSYNDGKLSGPVIKEVYTYIRDGILIKYIDLEIFWMLKSGEWSDDTKKVRKVFTDSQKILDEVKLRRANVISEVEGQAKDIGISEAIGQLFKKYFIEIGRYKESGSLDFANLIEADQELKWLDYPTRKPGVSIRQHLSFYFRVGCSTTTTQQN